MNIPRKINILNEDSSESNTADSADSSHTVAELMAKLETEGTDPTEEREHESTTSGENSDKLPEETWKKMSYSQRKNYLRSRKTENPGAHVSNPKDGKKRGREQQLTPSPKNTEKKLRLDFSGAAGSIKVAVAHEDYPHQKIGDKYFQDLLMRLLKEIRERKPDLPSVGFNGYFLRDGALVVNCRDELTKEWFVGSVAGLSPWEGVPLKTCDPKELEAYIKMGAFIPNPVEGIKECLYTMNLQNAGLQTEKWKVLGSKTHSHGMYLVVSIPESVAKNIEERGCRILHGFHNIQVRIFAGKDPARQEKATTGVGVVVETGGEGVAVSAPGVPGPASGQSASGAVKHVIKRQRTEHGGKECRAMGRGVADASGPVDRGPSPGGMKGETPPPPSGDPPTKK